MTPAESERHFDELMRQKLATDEVQPSAALWPAVSATLPVAPPRPPWRPVGAAAVGGLLLGALLGGWVKPGAVAPQPGKRQSSLALQSAAHDARALPHVSHSAPHVLHSASHVSHSAPHVLHSVSHVLQSPSHVLQSALHVSHSSSHVSHSSSHVSHSSFHVSHSAPHVLQLAPAEATVLPGDGHAPTLSVPSLWQVALTQDAAIRHEAGAAVAPIGSDSASKLPALIVTQRATLRALQHQLDSLKAALPAEPTALATLPEAPPAHADSSAKPALPPAPRWAVALLADATTPWGALPGPADTRQTLGAATQRSVQVEFQPENSRWRLRAGLGEVRQTGNFRAATEQTRQTTVSDTTLSTHIDVFSRTDTTLIIQIDSIPQLNPVINGGGQIIGYDTLWARITRTSYQLIVTNDTVRRTTQSVQTRQETQRTRREQQLRPTYRFWTLPVAAQFDVLRRGRWRAGLGAGAQLRFFRGGEAPTWVGDGYALRPVGPRGGPFRPVSLALTATLAIRYQLTHHLSLLAGTGAQGWAIAPLRADTQRRLQPTGHLGVAWGLGSR